MATEELLEENIEESKEPFQKVRIVRQIDKLVEVKSEKRKIARFKLIETIGIFGEDDKLFPGTVPQVTTIAGNMVMLTNEGKLQIMPPSMMRGALKIVWYNVPKAQQIIELLKTGNYMVKLLDENGRQPKAKSKIKKVPLLEFLRYGDAEELARLQELKAQQEPRKVVEPYTIRPVIKIVKEKPKPLSYDMLPTDFGKGKKRAYIKKKLEQIHEEKKQQKYNSEGIVESLNTLDELIKTVEESE